MYLKSVTLKNFRNIEEVTLNPSQGVNVIYGDNANGKTNILEGIWMFSGFHSFRTTKDAELVRFGENKAGLYAAFEDERRDHEAEISITNRRNISLNGISLKSPVGMIGNFNAVIFAPDFMSIVKEGPANRRDFIDTAVCQLTPSYTNAIRDYNRAVTQRNSLIKQDVVNFSILDVLDEELAMLGERVIKLRRRYLEVLTPFVTEIYSGLSGGKEEITLNYLARHNEDGKGQLLNLLRENRQRDIVIGTTTVGPHRDDIEIKINGINARDYGSQGQQRSCAIALKLGEAAIIAEKTEKKPIILLDDVMSELDTGRQDYILNHIGDRQVFITCCEPETILRMGAGKSFRIENGKCTEEKDNSI